MSLSEQGDILIRELFTGQMTASRHAELEDWLRKDAKNAKLLAEFAIIDRLLFTEQKHLDASAILALLLEAEENAEPILVTPPDAKEHKARKTEETSMTFKQAYDVLSYVLVQGIRGRAKTLAGIGMAAMLAIGLILTIALAGGSLQENVENPPLALDPAVSEPATAPIAVIQRVATFTAEQDAHWQAASGTLLPSIGAGLQPGDRLTLTAGLAEITTGRGAIVVLEAPATIELVEDNNSMILHNGKMVGICETPSSKGLLIRTPMIDITDLGTRFGVDITPGSATEVHVFEGEVSVALPTPHEASGKGQVLARGQAIRMQSGQDRFHVVEQDASRFASLNSIQQQGKPGRSPMAGVRQMTGDIKGAPKGSFIGKEAEQWPDGENAFIFQEYVGRLDSIAHVNIAQPNSRKNWLEPKESAIDSGTKVRSYIIAAKPGSSDASRILRGSIEFDREVVGIITQGTTAQAFADVFGRTKQLFDPSGGEHGWMDPNNFEEYVTLSEDRRTVSFSMQVKLTSDTIRILVDNGESR